MLYRPAEEKDLENLTALAIASYGQIKTYLTADNWKKMQAVLAAPDNFPLMIHNSFGFVCEEKGSLLGMAFLVPSGNPTKIYSKDTSYIRMVGVHPKAVGNGIAQSLTRLCIEKATATGEHTISLHSAEIMFAARHVYEKLGFKKIRMLDSHYGLQYWLYTYEIP
jgi:ribosomal protein S18 acetylase RimI-like enzyme